MEKTIVVKSTVGLHASLAAKIVQAASNYSVDIFLHYKTKTIDVKSILGLMSLASCSSTSFYKDWHNAGADIDEEVPFEYISFDKAKAMKDNKETFLVMFGSPSDSQDVKDVQGLCYDAYVTNQKNKIYFVNCDDASSVSVREKYRKELGVKNVLSPSYSEENSSDEVLSGLVAVLYKNGIYAINRVGTKSLKFNKNAL